MTAFRLAKEAGADGIELDVHMTKDGEAVVLHDEELDRTTNGSGWVKDHLWAELKELECGLWFTPPFAGERLPTLAQVLEWAREARICLNIELKNNWVPYSGLEERVIQLVDRYHMADAVIVSSFNHASLKQLGKLKPRWSLAALTDSKCFEPWRYARQIGVTALHPHYRLVDEEMVASCRQHGIDIRPYTVNETEEIERFLAMGVAGIITNYPDRVTR